MVLTIDAGNTNIAIGLFDGADADAPVDPGAQLVRHWRLSSRTHRTADEFALHLCELLRMSDVDPHVVDQSVVCCVVPTLTRAIADGVARALAVRPLLVNATVPLPIAIGTDDPSELGGDLIANAVGGFARSRGACIVVDFGTALTFTTVDADACMRGAAIAPGLDTAVHGLVSRTSALPMVDLLAPERFIGTNTTSALRSGIMNGYAGLVDRMVDGIRAELGGGAAVLMTGGQSGLIAGLTETKIDLHPWLTLEGLYHIVCGTAFT